MTRYIIEEIGGFEREVSKFEFYFNKTIYMILLGALCLACIGVLIDIIRFN